MKKTTRFTLIKAGILSAALGGLLVASPQNSYAHGYVEQPASRGYQGKLESSILGWSAAIEKYGNVITGPQSLEAPKGYPFAGPADGKIASADGGGGQIGDFVMDKQSSDRWIKQEMKGGLNTFKWTFTANHKTTKWHYYITKKGWNQNAPLTRATFEPIGIVEHDGSLSSNNPTHKINVPTDRNGYNVILAVWDVADTGNAFYNVIDVNLKNDNTGETEKDAPNAPTQLKAINVTNKTVQLAWAAPTNVDVKEYNMYRNDKKIGTIGGTSFKDSTVAENSSYHYQVEAVGFDGQLSQKSDVLSVKTDNTPKEDTENPSIPQSIHSMETTADSIDLMWHDSIHPIGIKEYHIYRDGVKVGTATGTRMVDSNLQASTEYRYTVKAVSVGGNVSGESTPFIVKTKDTSTDYRSWEVGSLTKPLSYKVGEKIFYKGKNYVVVLAHINYGDTNWAPDKAVNLFKEVKSYRVWKLGALTKPEAYKIGEKVSLNEKIYEVTNAHNNYGDSNWAPDKAASLFKVVK